MKIIDLLNKIANGEEVPKKIKVHNRTYFLTDKRFTWYNWYMNEEDNTDYDLFENSETNLNDEVEILEKEKKIPEKFKINYEIDEENTINLTPATMLECDLACKINEIIDYLNSKGDK